MTKLCAAAGRFNLRLIFLVFVIVASCKTAKPKDDVLDPSSIPKVEAPNEGLQLDADPNTGGSTLWSPAQRRANASYQYLIAMKTLLKGDFKSALPILESSYNLDPNSYTGSQLVEAKMLTGDVAEAEKEAHRMTLLYPKDEKHRMQYGQVLIFKNDLPAAEMQLRRAIEINPKYEDAYVLLVKVLLGQKKQTDVLKVVQKLVEIVPNSAKGLSLLVRLQLAAKHNKEALAPAKKMWLLQPGQPESALLYGMTLDLNGRPKEAIQLYEQLYRVNPSNQELVQRMVSLYQEIGNLEDGLSLIDEMISRTNQRHPALIMQRALILSEIGRHAEASATMEELVKENPDSDRILFMSGLALEKIGKLEMALKRYESIPDDSPIKMSSSYRKAFVLKLLGKTQESIDFARSLVKRAEADAGTWQVLIELLADTKSFDRARDAASEASKLYPDKVLLLFLLGVYQERTGQTAESEQTMKQVIKLEGNNASALNFLGYMLVEQGRDLDYAESLILKALQIKPGDGSYLDSLGWLYYQKKQYPKALETLKRALDASPKEGVIMEHIGDVLAAQKDLNGALQSYEKALATDLDERDKPRIEQKAKEIRQRNN